MTEPKQTPDHKYPDLAKYVSFNESGLAYTNYQPMPIQGGFRLTRDQASELTSQKIPRRVFDWDMQGSRILVLVDEVPEKIGSLVLTPAQQDMANMGTGWILAVGPEAGVAPSALAIGDVRANEHASDLLGLHILFGVYTGQVLRFSLFDSDYKSKIMVIAPADIWCVDTNLSPPTFEEQYEEQYGMTVQAREDEEAELERQSGQALEDQRERLITLDTK